ncbi:hypothetical protein D0Q02_30405 [Micromonospora craniellae]|uniref:Uncharacterized protein n=1 Tax=Micromonospora craniellae TaxID=2294034 RepID=A0A372FQY4_9ACTN|nr:hypothetical protein D0Q02_30405 [Micromonospora craniellae]
MVSPVQRRSDEIAASYAYEPGALVWVWAPRDAQWCPGRIENRSAVAVLATYRRPGGATGVDSVLPRDVMARTDPDPIFDRVDGALPLRSVASTVPA